MLSFFVIEQFYFILGPREPVHHVPTTPEKSPSSSNSTEIFLEDNSSISESDHDDETPTTWKKMKTLHQSPRPPLQPFKFRKIMKNEPANSSPTSSPIMLPSPDPILIISSDEELEHSMIEEEKRISLEMDSD